MDKNISIITNFGCNHCCWYCIWGNHTLRHVHIPTDWDALYAFLYKYKDKGKVSVSGGGDPLYEYGEVKHYLWWKKLFEITSQLDMLVDVHTREKMYDRQFYKRINRCVFSSDLLQEDEGILLWSSRYVKLRVVHVVTPKTTRQMIEDYLSYQADWHCQFSIKQLVGYDDNGMYDSIRREFPDIYHIDKGDYNVYFMPDNTIRDTFFRGE